MKSAGSFLPVSWRKTVGEPEISFPVGFFFVLNNEIKQMGKCDKQRDYAVLIDFFNVEIDNICLRQRRAFVTLHRK